MAESKNTTWLQTLLSYSNILNTPNAASPLVRLFKMYTNAAGSKAAK